MSIYKELGKSIREIRIGLNLTQEKLAELAGLSSNFISQIERGRNKCSLDTIHKLSIALNTPLPELFSFISTPTKTKDIYQKRIEMLLNKLQKKDKKLLLDISEDVFRKIKKK